MAISKLSVIFPHDYQNANKISVIKALRTLTGLGLKEAKDACEIPNNEQIFQIISIGPAVIEEQLQVLKAAGCVINEPGFLILSELRALGASALEQGEDELANEILQLVLAEKLRRSK